MSSSVYTKDEILRELADKGFFVDTYTLDTFFKIWKIDALFEDNGVEFFDKNALSLVLEKLFNKQPEIEPDDEYEAPPFEIKKHVEKKDDDTPPKTPSIEDIPLNANVELSEEPAILPLEAEAENDNDNEVDNKVEVEIEPNINETALEQEKQEDSNDIELNSITEFHLEPKLDINSKEIEAETESEVEIKQETEAEIEADIKDEPIESTLISETEPELEINLEEPLFEASIEKDETAIETPAIEQEEIETNNKNVETLDIEMSSDESVIELEQSLEDLPDMENDLSELEQVNQKPPEIDSNKLQENNIIQNTLNEINKKGNETQENITKSEKIEKTECKNMDIDIIDSDDTPIGDMNKGPMIAEPKEKEKSTKPLEEVFNLDDKSDLIFQRDYSKEPAPQKKKAEPVIESLEIKEENAPVISDIDTINEIEQTNESEPSVAFKTEETKEAENKPNAPVQDENIKPNTEQNTVSIDDLINHQEDDTESDIDDLTLLSESFEAQEKFRDYVVNELKRKNFDISGAEAESSANSQELIDKIAKSLAQNITKQVSKVYSNDVALSRKYNELKEKAARLELKNKELEKQNKKLRLLLVESNKNLNSYKPSIFGLYKKVKPEKK